MEGGDSGRIKNDPLFAEVYSAYQKFRDQYAIWGEKGYLK